MTVRDLIEELENFDEDMEVVIGMQQNYGCDFAYTVNEVEELPVKDWDNDREDRVVLTMGRQFGTDKYEEI